MGEVPEVEVREYVRQVHRAEVKYVDKVIEVPVTLYEERPVYMPQVVQTEAITKVPKPQMQYVHKKVPKTVLQAQERIVDFPVLLQQERAVEVPQIVAAEFTVQVPREEVQVVEKPVPKVYTEAREIVQEVPKVFTEERMAFVPQVQTHDVITHVSVPQVKVVEKPIPKIETQVREKIVQKPATLIEEVAHEYEEKFQVEVVKERHAGAQQRIVQTAREWVQGVHRDAVVIGTGAAIQGGYVEAQHTGQSRMKETVDRDLVLYDAGPTIVSTEYVKGQANLISGQETTTTRDIIGIPSPTTYVREIISPGTNITFDALDRDGDGVITRAEFNAAMGGTRIVEGGIGMPVPATYVERDIIGTPAPTTYVGPTIYPGTIPAVESSIVY